MKTREKKCLLTGEILPESRLIRLVIAPDDALLPDLAAKLPGRGMWISASRDAVEQAARKGLYNRSAGRAVHAPDDLADTIQDLLQARALSLLGLARRAGDLDLGFDACRLSLKAARPVWRIEASDGAADGREKLDRLSRSAWGEIPVLGCFDAETLGGATGRGAVVHAILKSGSQARAFDETIRKLSGFRIIEDFSTA